MAETAIETREPQKRPASQAVLAAADAEGAATSLPLGAYEALARSARLPDLVSIARSVAFDAAAARRAEWNHATKVADAATAANLPRTEADTPFGNALKVLESGPEGDAERALAGALLAHAVAEARDEDDERLAGDLLWLATHTAFDATPLLDRALGEDAADLWSAIAGRVKRILEGRGAALGRGEALVGAAALASSDSERARALCRELEAKTKDVAVARILQAGTTGAGHEFHLEGEAANAPRGPVLTAIYAVTGILFAIHVVRFVARVVLAYRRPAELSLSRDGLRLRSRTQVLGRTLRQQDQVILRAGLSRISREVRYPSAAFYAGLLALAVGSLIGVRALVDGVRAASPSLLILGLVIVALGIAADFVLGSLVPGARGRCRVIFVPRVGAALAMTDVDAARADDVVARVRASH